MKWLLNALSSSVGKKFLMAITGLLLSGFLVAHLAGNLLLPAGGTLFNDYARKLHENEGLLMVAETGLAAIFALHLWLALSLTKDNVMARGKGYAVTESKREDTISKTRPDKWMIGSGIILLLYICLHLYDFKLHRFGMDDTLNSIRVEEEQAVTTEEAIHILNSPLTLVGYAAGFVFLFAHLSHGVSSAFQSLGISHPKYNSLIRYGGLGFAALLSLGFFVVLIWGWMQ